MASHSTRPQYGRTRAETRRLETQAREQAQAAAAALGIAPTNVISRQLGRTRGQTRMWKEQKRRPEMISLFRLPKEIRFIIYGYTLSTPQTRSPSRPLRPIAVEKAAERLDLVKEIAAQKLKVRDLRREWRSKTWATCGPVGEEMTKAEDDLIDLERKLFKYPIPLDMSLICTSRMVFEEVHEYIASSVPTLFKLLLSRREFDDREVRLLETSKRIGIAFLQQDAAQSKDYKWAEQLRDALEPRDDMILFDFLGAGGRSIDKALNYAVSQGLTDLNEVNGYTEIIDTLDQLPVVRASRSVTVRWKGQQNLPAEHELLEEYLRYISYLQGGQAGND